MVLGAALLVLGGAIPPVTPAAGAPSPPVASRPLTVLSWNLYVGADLTPALTPPTRDAVPAAVSAVWAQAQTTDFSARAEALAAQVAATRPDVLAVQEAAIWRLQSPGDGPASPATAVAADFLRILRTRLAARGLRYAPAVSRTFFDGELTGADGVDVRLTDRDAILIRADRAARDLRAARRASGQFAAKLIVPTPLLPVPVPRGWTSVDLRVRGTTVRLVNTHLEGGDPHVQVQQARELLRGPLARRVPGRRGPGRRPYAVLVGDLNSRADGTGTSTYAGLRSAGFRDVWAAVARPGDAGLTCCHAPGLSDGEDPLRSRIDYVLARGALRPRRARVLGADPTSRTPSGLWPSDHAGVVATLRVAGTCVRTVRAGRALEVRRRRAVRVRRIDVRRCGDAASVTTTLSRRASVRLRVADRAGRQLASAIAGPAGRTARVRVLMRREVAPIEVVAIARPRGGGPATVVAARAR